MIPRQRCPHPILISDDDSVRYFYCPDCHATLQAVNNIGPLGKESTRYVVIGTSREQK